MISGQYDFPSGQRRILMARRSGLLLHHPVLMPVVLTAGAVGLYFVSFFANALFPVLAFLGVPTVLMCLLLAFVLGISAIVASIVSIIERIDQNQTRMQAELFAKPKKGV